MIYLLGIFRFFFWFRDPIGEICQTGGHAWLVVWARGSVGG